MRISILVIAIVTALAALVAPVWAQNTGVIQVQLVNGTPGGASVAGAALTLKTFSGGSEQGSKEAVSDAEGKFQFSGLATDSKYSYQIVAIYQEAEYDSDTITFKEGEPTQTVTMTVFDATDKADKLSFHASQIEFYVGQGRVEVVERYLISNDGDKTYIGSQPIPGDGRKSTLKFNLPPESDRGSIQMSSTLMDCCVVFDATGLNDTMAVIPGQKGVVFSHQIPYKSSQYTFTKTFAYPVTNFAVLLEDKGVTLSSDTVSGGQPVEFNGVNYLQYMGKDIPAGVPVTMTLLGLPQAGSQAFKWVAIAGAIVVAGVGLGYPLSRRRRAPVRVESRTRLDEENELLTGLARLDDEHEAGRLSEADYKARRARTKQRLIDLRERSGRQSRS